MCATYKRHLARLGQQTISTTAVETLCRISIASGRFRVEGKPKRTHEYIISTNATSKDWCKFRQLLLHQYLAPATTTPQPLVRSLRSLAPAGPPPSSTNSTETPTTRDNEQLVPSSELLTRNPNTNQQSEHRPQGKRETGATTVGVSKT